MHLYVQRDDASISFVSLIMGAILLKDKIAFNGTFLRLPFKKCNLEVSLFLWCWKLKGNVFYLLITLLEGENIC